MIESGPIFLISATDITERNRHAAEVRRSRARIVAAADEARKRLERNLHDGAQQHLISALLVLRTTRSKVDDDSPLAPLLDRAVAECAAAVDELRELARGIHPVVLTEQGLETALRLVAGRATFPVELDVPARRYPEEVEATAYYVVSEALVNVAKHAQASSACVLIREEGAVLLVTVADDGRGGADPEGGSGLRGLVDRVAAIDGSLTWASPPGAGTRVEAVLPLDGGRRAWNGRRQGCAPPASPFVERTVRPYAAIGSASGSVAARGRGQLLLAAITSDAITPTAAIAAPTQKAAWKPVVSAAGAASPAEAAGVWRPPPTRGSRCPARLRSAATC